MNTANHKDQTSLRAFFHPQAMEKWVMGSRPFDEKHEMMMMMVIMVISILMMMMMIMIMKMTKIIMMKMWIFVLLLGTSMLFFQTPV